MNQVDSIVGSIPAVQSRTAITGYSFVGGQGNTYGSFIIKLKPWDQRDEGDGKCICRARSVIHDDRSHKGCPNNVLPATYDFRLFRHQRF